MAYNYRSERHVVFTEEGIAAVMAIRDFVLKAINDTGAVTAGKAMNHAKGLCASWEMMACVDYLIERGDVRVHGPDDTISWQNRVLVKG